MGVPIRRLMEFFHINFYMLPVKVSYFFNQAVYGSYLTYFTVFLTSQGLSTSEAGIINGIKLTISCISGFLCGMLADRTKKHRLILEICCFTSILIMVPQPWLLQHIPGPVTSTFHTAIHNETHNPSSRIKQHGNNNDSILYALGNWTTKNHFHASPVHKKTSIFWLLLVVNALVSFFEGSTFGLTDTGAMMRVTTCPRETNLGRQLIFSGFGLAVGSLTSGVAIDYLHFTNVTKFTPVFLVYGAMAVPFGVTMYFVFNLKIQGVQKKRNFSGVLCQMLKEGPIIIYFTTVFMVGIGSHVNNTFLYVMLKELNVSTSTMGIYMFTASCSATIMQPFATYVIRFFKGSFPAMALASVTYAVRFIVYSKTQNATWYLWLVQTLHSIGHGLFSAAYIEYIFHASQREVQTTMTLAATCTYYYSSGLVANIVGGIVYESYGGHFLFRWTSILQLLWGTLIFGYGIYHRRQSEQKPTGHTNKPDIDTSDIDQTLLPDFAVENLQFLTRESYL